MSLKKFIIPQLVILLLLSAIWLAGADSILVDNDNDRKNLHKYMQVQRRVIDNYFGDTNLNDLYRKSITGLVLAMDDSTLEIDDTPIDTTFSDDSVTNLRDSYNRFENAYLYIANNYPDKNMDELTESAIREMLSTLDPHSVYIEPDNSERIQENFDGKFQGIGIQFNIIQDTITVITPISGGPSDQLGIMSGDRIISINDSSAIGFDNQDVVSRLRGKKGTEVSIEVKRPNRNSPLTFNIVRDDIPITTLDTHYMLDNDTGYIKINRFAATTHDEFITAVNGLNQKGMERLMLDLRNNPGGYLSQAIAISEEFFPENTLLVSTESKHQRFNSEVYSRRDGLLKDMPVITLVNEGSASASEIVSGALQDHDRGLVVGRRTFGKGLVQQQYELVDNSNIRVTISRYLTPSGRLIQKPFKGRTEDYAYEIYDRSNDATVDTKEFKQNVPDSLRYTTKGGRVVYGGGGIVPDFVVQEDTTVSGELFSFLISNRIDFDYVRNFLDENGEQFRTEWEENFEGFRDNFEWSESNQQALLSKMKSNGLEFDSTIEAPEFEGDTLRISQDTYHENLWVNLGRMKAELARQVWGSDKFYVITNDLFNDTLREAMKLWDEADRITADYASSNSSGTVRIDE